MEIGAVRNLAKTMLRTSGADNSFWPLAIRCASETRFRQQLRELGVGAPQVLPFGLRALARKKPWHCASSWDAPNIPVRLWGPASDLSLTSGGYYAETQDGKYIRTTAIIVPKWKSQACQVLHSEPPQLLNPETPIDDSIGLVNHDTVPGLYEPGVAGQALDFQSEGLEGHDHEQSLEIVQEVEINLEDPPTSLPETVPPKRRLYGKTTPTLVGSNSSPTLRRMALRVGGESVRQELQQMTQWMLLQHELLGDMVQELLIDVEHGTQGSEGALQQVKKEVLELEVSLRKVNADEGEAVHQELEEVLQTRTVPIQEVRQNMAEWYQPFKEEYDTLCQTVIQPLSPKEARDTISQAERVERIPSKIVPTIKPPHKKRGRIVACGNYATTPDGETAAGGIETICLRALLRTAADRGWSVCTIDVRKAFLDAPRVEKKGHVTILEPPAVLVSMGSSSQFGVLEGDRCNLRAGSVASRLGTSQRCHISRPVLDLWR